MDPCAKISEDSDQCFYADASIIAFSNRSLKQSHIADCPTPSLLSLSGELRNEIYSHLLPDSINIREVKGLLLSCKQIRAELHSLLMRCAKQALEAPKKVHLHTPQVETYTQLRNVTVQLYCTYGRSSDHRESRNEGSFVNAFANLRALLALHLTYVTVAIPLQFQAGFDMQQPLVRFRVLQNSLETFKICNQYGTANAKHVIFDYTPTLMGPLPHPGHRPYMAFVRQENRSHKVDGVPRRMRKARYAMLGHDASYDSLGLQMPNGQLLETDERMMATLEEIIRLSRQASDATSSRNA